VVVLALVAAQVIRSEVLYYEHRRCGSRNLRPGIRRQGFRKDELPEH